jgi:ABC-2 type transport system permease protein
VEIHPDQHTADIRGSYRLVNSSAVPIDSIHVATRAAVETRAVTFDRPAMLVVEDEELEHRIYALKEPLRPGDSLTLHFDLRFEPHGFRNGGADASVVANGTYFRNRPWFPAIGYQRGRTLSDAGDRRTHGLPPRVAIPSLYDVEARQDISGSERIAFDAVVGTDDDQVAVAPGVLRRTWTEKGRRYFHYVADAPILDDYPVVSANYALHEGRWKDVAIEIFNHPEHTGNAERVLRSVQASLEWFTAQYGPYPYRVIRIVEHPGPDIGAHADGSHITHEEGFTRFAPDDGPRGLDLPFYIVAHEVAHQWWGAAQLAPAPVEGAILLVEGLATYSGMQVLENAYGPEQMRRFLREVRASYEVPRTRATVPLLRATDGFLARRKAPLALYALSRYIGQDRVNSALRRLIEKHGAAAPPLPTTLDLYRELQAVTPDSLHYLLYDLFEANTYWALETDEVSADSTATGEWRVTLDVRARKVVIDTAAVETEVPMDDLIEIGVFAPDGKDQSVGRTLYLEKHRVRSGRQTITVTVRSTPGRAGIDPDQLLIDLKPDDNVRNVRPAVGTP